MNALILSYNALPMDVVSSYRVKGYCDYFHQFGIYPTLLTHRWEKDGSGNFMTHKKDAAITTENYNTCRIIRLPYPGRPKLRRNRLRTLFEYCRGNFEPELWESYKIFKEFVVKHVCQNHYDVIVAVYNPHYHLKLAYELHTLFKIPYILDFRDLWNNLIVTKSYSPSLKEMLINKVIQYWWKKWLSNVLFFCTTGEKWRKYLLRISDKKGYVVRNGFDQLFVPTSGKLEQRIFKIVHFGRFYENQNIGTFINGYKLFLESVKPQNVVLEIIGPKSSPGVNIMHFLERLPLSNWRTIEYLPKDRLMNYCSSETSLFWFPGFNEDNGQFSVKVYDYLILNKNILMCPGDNSDAQEVITSVGAGKIANSADEVYQYLSKQYNEFIRSGHLEYQGDKDAIMQYAREFQVRFFADKINEHLSFIE